MRPMSVRNIKLFFYLLAIASLPALISYQAVFAEDLLQIPSSELSIPGIAQKSSEKAPAVNSSAYAEFSSAEAMTMKFKEVIPHTRGPQDVSLFRQAAPSVVLVLVKDGLGSGSLLQDNVILTNFHVVDHNREVTVVFKPTDPSGKPTEDEIVKADVVKIDVLRDLALVRPRTLPHHSVHPLQIFSQDIEVGADVRAIGHPKGEEWTYTKGIVSAIRPDFEWSGSPGDSHRATVIQTQTPINPGNSGGPLLSDDGKIAGVNSFGTKDSEGLNFAVSAKDINYFLKNQANGLEALNTCNEPKVTFEGRNKKNNASLRVISLQCDDYADITLVAPDNKKEPVFALVDLKRRGKPEGVVFDQQRSGKWNISYWDSQLDDTFALRGIHPDGKLMPSSFEPRCGNRKPLKDLKCA